MANQLCNRICHPEPSNPPGWEHFTQAQVANRGSKPCFSASASFFRKDRISADIETVFRSHARFEVSAMYRFLLPAFLAFASTAFVSAQDSPPSSPAETESSPTYSFERKQFNVFRNRGHVYYGNAWYDHPIEDQPVRTKLIEAIDGQHFDRDHDVFKWARMLRGARTYTYDTVTQHDGEQTTDLGPLLLLPEDQREEIVPHWEKWVKDQEQVSSTMSMRLMSASHDSPTSGRTSEAYRTTQPVSVVGETVGNTYVVGLLPNRRAYQGVLEPPSGTPFTTPISLPPVLATNGPINPPTFTPTYITVRGLDSGLVIQQTRARFPGYTIASVRQLRRSR